MVFNHRKFLLDDVTFLKMGHGKNFKSIAMDIGQTRPDYTSPIAFQTSGHASLL